MKVAAELEDHLTTFFKGHPHEHRQFERGPINKRLADFHVEVFGPGPRTSLWSYVTCGAGKVATDSGHRWEFLLLGMRDEVRWVELASMVAYYHAGPDTQRFGVGHTVPLGEPVVQGSQCDNVLFCVPYPLGPQFEKCELSDGTHLQILWALPITAAEKAFKLENGLEELEAHFEQRKLEYWDLSRSSTV
jgi:suppressor of fused protein SUFU